MLEGETGETLSVSPGRATCIGLWPTIQTKACAWPAATLENMGGVSLDGRLGYPVLQL